MGVLGTSLLDNSGLPTPFYLPNASRIQEVRKKSSDTAAQVQAKKFSALHLPSVAGLPVVPVSLFFSLEKQGRYGIKSDDSDGKKAVDMINFSLIKEERHTMKSSVSMHPIENGSPVSDHVQRDTRSGSFVGLVTNFSLLTATSQTLMNGGSPINRRPPNLAREAYDALKELWLSGQVVTLVLVLDTYQNVVITDISAPRNDRSGDSIEFDISFVQVQKIKLREIGLRITVHPPRMHSGIQRRAGTKKKGGDVGGYTATENKTEDFIELNAMDMGGGGDF